MKKLLMILGTAAALLTLGANGPEEGFRSPPRSASPHALYHLMNGNVTKEGITCDFEALSAAGIGGVQVFDVGCYIPPGPVVFGTPEWFGLMRHVHEEGKRLGLEVSLRDSSGWSNSGGPWITPDKAMKVIVAKSAFAKGPSRFHAVLERGVKDDNGWYEDIRVLAFPTPKPGARLTHLSDKTGRTRTRQPLYRALGNHRPDFLDDPVPPNDRREHPSRDVKEFPPEMAVAKESVIDVTAHMAADGTFDWDVPAGDWTIMRVGAACNGRCNHPAARGGRGLEVDKLSASAVEHHFNAYAARLCDALGIHRGSPKSNAGLTTIHIDSYEVGGQNWTQGLDAVFERRTGRSLVPFLPVFANRIVGSVAETEDFLECFRRVIADLFAENYAGTMARLCHERGLAFSLEPYGNCVADDLQYGQDADTPIAEFWSNAMLGDHGVGGTGNARHAAYLAHVWGRRRAGAEAFTAHPRNGGCWATTPFSIKGQTDRAYAAGVNCIFYHRFAHQPWAGNKYLPGMTMGRWGMHLDRTQTWWHIAPEFFTYQARCQWMLQEGLYAADLLYWCGEAAPNFGLGCRRPPAGYAWDVCATKALEMLKVRNGKVVVPGGVEYELLVLPQGKIGERMRRRIAELEAQGAKVVDPAKETPGAALRRLGIAPDFICTAPDVSWIHRKGNGADWYFVACDNATNATFEASFRQTGRQPEIWNAETGETTDSVNWREEDGRTVVVLDFPPSGSAFVVFRRPAGKTGESGNSGTTGTTGITGPWQVSFPVDWYMGGNAVKSFVWPALKDWTSDADPDVKYFSGTATYRVSCPMSHVPPDTRAILDLGDVKNFAEITVNGRKYPPLWRPPFRVDVTDAIRAGVKDAIDIEVKVTNLWPNRLIGDDRLCSDDCDWSAHRREKTVVEYGIKRIPEWVKQGRRSPTGRHTFTTWKHWTKDDAPLPSGLLGPVVFRFEKAGTRQVERAAPAADFTLEKSGVRHDLGRGHDARHDTRRLAGAEIKDPSLIRVDIDIVREGTVAAEWFLRRGFRNFAYCGFHGVGTYPFNDILESAFAASVEKAGHQCLMFNMPPVTSKSKRYLHVLQLALDKWVATLPPRTAVFCVHDRRAVVLAQACLTCGRAVPDDIAIMGRNNDITTCVCAPVPITSVNSNLEGQGFAAMRLLADAIKHPVAPKLRPVFRVPPLGIVERESTAVYPVDPPFLAKALLLLDENMERPVSAAALAKVVGVSSSTLRAAFRKVLGTSLGKYALSVRMREAKRLMMEDRLSVKEIAARTGFSSQAYFSAAYRAFYGHPPSRDHA